jgi:hypothetical protein
MRKSLTGYLGFPQILLLPFLFTAVFLDILFCIPLAGRALKWIWNIVLSVFHYLLGLIEWGFWLLGIRPVKKMRLGFLLFRDPEGNLLSNPDSMMRAVQNARTAFAQAGVEILPAFPPPKRLTEEGESPPSEHWYRILPYDSTRPLARVGCNLAAALQDLGIPGMYFQYHTLTNFFETGPRRLTGYGSPITVFAVPDIVDFGGCSLGWLTDYVTVQHNSLLTTAHELGHACGLGHREDTQNIMHPSSGRLREVTMTSWQIAVIRASRHVTRF